MAQIRIIAVGKLKESYLLQAQAEYVKRLKPYLNLELDEVYDLPCPDSAGAALEDRVRQKEGDSIKRLLRPKDYLVMLDREGRQLSSLDFADFLSARAVNSDPVVFIIGGSLGLPGDMVKSAQLNLSFSRLTFPHQLFRVMLLEQIYRAVKINRGEPYHK